jgi:hypothetical protein
MATCPLPRPNRFTSKNPQATWAAPRTSCAQNCTAATLHCSDLGPPLLRRLRPSPAAPSSAFPCCCTRSEGRHPELHPPEGLKNEWILSPNVCYSLLLMLSDAPTTPIVFWFMWVVLHRGWLAPSTYSEFISLYCCLGNIHIYQYICQYMTIWVYIPWSIRRRPDNQGGD